MRRIERTVLLLIKRSMREVGLLYSRVGMSLAGLVLLMEWNDIDMNPEFRMMGMMNRYQT